MAVRGAYMELRDMSKTIIRAEEDDKLLQTQILNGADDPETLESACPPRLEDAPRNWRLLVRSGVFTASIVLVINIAVLAVAYSRLDEEDHVATVFTTNCGRANNIVTGAHFVINVLSTLLLAASNTSMQCLSAPTRQEVDTIHKQEKVFIIGMPSVTNIFRKATPKRLLWLLLASSSLPLHLLWNSTVFQTLGSNTYFALSIAQDFTAGASWVDPSKRAYSSKSRDRVFTDLGSTIADMQALARAQDSHLQRLERSDCIEAYSQELMIDRRNLLMITNSSDYTFTPEYMEYLNTTQNTTSLLAAYVSSFAPSDHESSLGGTYGWMCVENNGPCKLPTLLRLSQDQTQPWIPGTTGMLECNDYGCGINDDSEVLYCLSEQVPSQCKVSLIPAFLIIVCICNVMKITAMVLTLQMTRDSDSENLITQGDAIQSFLKNPDPLLQGGCLADWDDFLKAQSPPKTWQEILQARKLPGRSHRLAIHVSATDSADQRPRRSWASAVGATWWVLTYLGMTIFLAAIAYFFTGTWFLDQSDYGQTEDDASWTTKKAQGVGQPQAAFSTGQGVPILTAFFAANLPQLLLVYIYLIVNTMLSAMLGMAEWSSYYVASQAEAKGLRVSRPVAGSKQTSSYFLTIPLQWAVPSLVAFTLLHWLTSQMLFAARVEMYSPSGQPGASVTGIYYAPIVTYCVVGITSTAMLAFLGMALIKRFPADVPLAGNCSASIAAACQPLPEEDGKFEPDLALKALRWGVVKIPHSTEDVGHATLSAGPVGRLVPGMVYA